MYDTLSEGRIKKNSGNVLDYSRRMVRCHRQNIHTSFEQTRLQCFIRFFRRRRPSDESRRTPSYSASLSARFAKLTNSPVLVAGAHSLDLTTGRYRPSTCRGPNSVLSKHIYLHISFAQPVRHSCVCREHGHEKRLRQKHRLSVARPSSFPPTAVAGCHTPAAPGTNTSQPPL